MGGSGGDSFILSEKLTIQLLRLYRQKEFLWNKELPDYTNRRKRQAAYRDIVTKLKVPGLEIRHIKLKLRSYRDMYIRDLKGKRGLKPLPYWFKEISFLKNHLQIDKSEILLEDFEDTQYLEPFEDEDIAAIVKTEPENMADDSNILIVDNDLGNNDYNIAYDDQSDYNYLNNPKAKRQKIEHVELPSTSTDQADNVLTSIERTQKEILVAVRSQSSDSGDYFDNFAKYVANLLRSLPKSKAYALQPKIIEIITDEQIKLSEKSE